MANIVNALKSPFARLAALWPRRSAPEPVATEEEEEQALEENVTVVTDEQVHAEEEARQVVPENTATDQAEPEDEQEEQDEVKPGWREKLAALFSFHKRSVAADEAGDEVAGDDSVPGDGVDTLGVDDEADLPPAKPSWKMRLAGLLRRLPFRKRATETEEGAEDEEDAGGRRRPGDDAEDEEELRPSFMARAKEAFTGMPAKLSYVASLVVGAVVVTQYGMWQIVAKQNEALDALHSKNVELRKEKRDLEKREQKLVQRAARAETAAVTTGGGAEGSTSADLGDCAVTNTKDAASNLKRCIEQYNALTGR